MSDTNNNLLLQEEKQDSKQYRRTLWWVEHRELLGNIGIALLAVFDACLIIFVGWNLIETFIVSAGPEQRALVESISNNQEDLHAYTTARAATEISISDTQIFSSGNNAYDFYTQIENPNTDWWAEFQYNFIFDSGSTSVKDGFILPGSTKPVVELAFTSAAGIGSAQLQLQSVSWHRIDHHTIPDYTKWSEDRLGLEITNPTISQETSADAHGLFRTTFTVRNNTAYNYYNPTFYLLLKRGASVTGVNKTVLQTLTVGETRDIVVNWFGTIPPASQIEVIPELNLFDPMLYKSLEGSQTIDTRSFAP